MLVALSAALGASALVAAPAVAGGAAPSQSKAAPVIVFNGEGDNLNAYSSKPPFKKQTVIRNHDDDPEGLDINAQICFFPDGSNRFVAGEDTGQPDPPQGWGIFKLRGSSVGKLSAEQVGKLTPTYQTTLDNAENYGCGFLSDGRIVTTDIGNQATGDPTGQLIVWFPPFNSRDVEYCKLDIAIATAGGIYVDKQDRIYVASARPPSSGVYRYTGPFPTSADAAGGCASQDSTGAPMVDSVDKELFIGPENDLLTPSGIVRSPNGKLYVSSVFNGVINEYDPDGTYVRTVLHPPEGESLGEQTFTTGTPFGLGVGPDGTLYYADIAIVVSPEGVGPGPDGKVRRLRFVDGEPRPPQTMGAGLAFPDGIGVYVPRKR